MSEVMQHIITLRLRGEDGEPHAAGVIAFNTDACRDYPHEAAVTWETARTVIDSYAKTLVAEPFRPVPCVQFSTPWMFVSMHGTDDKEFATSFSAVITEALSEAETLGQVWESASLNALEIDALEPRETP